jgi:hypothetical protein
MTAPESPRADVELTEAERLADELFSKGFTHRSRDDVARWVVESDWLADRLAAVQAERDAMWEPIVRKVTADLAVAEGDRNTTEAERDDLRARLLAVETLVGSLASRNDNDRLRAVLASPSTHTQRDTETAAQALREAADELDAESVRVGGMYAGDCTDLLRARADSLDTGAGS